MLTHLQELVCLLLVFGLKESFLLFSFSTIPLLAFALKSFVSLMDHNIVSWDIVDATFIAKVGTFFFSLSM